MNRTPAREADLRPPHYDELRDAGGAVRAHWRPLTDALTAMAPEEYARRRSAAELAIRDNGVTYNVYDGAGGQARPWQLDVVPSSSVPTIGGSSPPVSCSARHWPMRFSETSMGRSA